MLYLKCSTSSCRYIREFFTSAKVSRAFEINQRIVYTMRSHGHGYAGIKKLNTLINIPKPVTVKNYNKTISKVIDVVKSIAEVTMNDAAKEFKKTHCPQLMILLIPVFRGM